MNGGSLRSPDGRWPASFGSSRALAQCARAAAGRVLAVFPEIVYLGTDAGDVVALSAGKVPLTPLSISVEAARPAFPDWLSMEARVGFLPGEVHLDGAVIELREAKAWDPHLPAEVLGAAAIDWPGGLAFLLEAIRQASPQGSLAVLLEESQPPMDRETEARLLRAASMAARTALEALAHAIQSGDPEPLRLAAESLAGLGGGFTPAGDDFLVGMMLALRVARPLAQARSLAGMIAESATPRTASVSAAYLRAAADGAASMGWHRLLDALRQDDRQGTLSAVADLCAIGHSSGADSLAGFSLALQALPLPLRSTV